MASLPHPSVNRLAAQLSGRKGQPRVPGPPVPLWRKGQIVTVGGTTCSITLGTSTVLVPGVKFPPSYSPTIGDYVWVILSATRGGVGPADIVIVQQHQ